MVRHVSHIDFDTMFDTNYLEKIDSLERFNGGNKYCASYEYIPAKANYDYLIYRNDKVAIISGNIKVTNEQKINNNMSFKVVNGNFKSTIELPYIYYPGYDIRLNEKKLKYFESENGLIMVKIDKNSTGDVSVKYRGTIISKVSFGISVVSFICFIYYIIRLRKL